MSDGQCYLSRYIEHECYPSEKKGKCVRPNYIPHKTPNDAVYENWRSFYLNQLIDMYNITSNIVKSSYLSSNNIDWKNTKIFDDFCTMIYNNSSKHISEYMDASETLI